MTPEQLKARQLGVGGSETAAALDLNPWKSSRELYEEKTAGEEVIIVNEPSEPMRWGTLLEPVIRQEYAERTGRTVRVPTEALVHPTHTFMRANPDGLTDDGRLLEVKCASSSYGWGDPGSDQIPQHYLLQVQHYLAVTALPVADVATLVAGCEFRQYEVAADLELQEMIIDGLRVFWRAVESRTPPEVDLDSPRALEIVRKLYQGTSGEILTASDHLEHWRAVYDDSIAAENRYQAVANGAKAHLLHAMGEASELRFADGKALRRRLQKRKAYTVAFPETSFIDARFVSVKD
jgi:putative phage-type endonuclease